MALPKKKRREIIKTLQKSVKRNEAVVKNLLDTFGPAETFELAQEVARQYVYKLKNQGEISFSEPVEGESPTIHVTRRTLPEVWEDTMMALMGIGQKVHTHYDPGHGKEKYESFPSLEATTMMHIQEPRGEPRFHMHFLAGQFGDYKAEMQGIKDHWVLDPKIVANMLKWGRFQEIEGHTGWLYSYSQRIRSFPYLNIEAKPKVINQLQSVIDNLTNNPLSRSAQVTTWDPRWDQNDGQMKYRTPYPDGEIQEAIFDDYHAPCLQRVHFRLIPFKNGFKLNSNTHWRSRCHPKAVPHNIYGMIEGLIEPQRADIEKALKVPVTMGRYVDINDSLHVYGHYLDPRIQGKDAEAYLEDIFRITLGQPIEKRLIMPGTPIHEMTMEGIEKEYQERIANPDKGRSMS